MIYGSAKGRKIKSLYIKYQVRRQNPIGINTGDIFMSPLGAALSHSE